VSCTGCVTVDELKFDKDVDLGAKNLTTTGTVAAASFTGDGSKLSGIKIPAGKCDAGKVLTGLNADGTLVCSTFTITPAGLPNDGIDEISNGLLKNQFTYVNAGKPNLAIPDYNLGGVSDTITVPNNLGLAQKLTVTVNISKQFSGIEKEFTVKLVDPNNKEYILHDKTSTLSGATLTTTWPEPTKTISGDLTTWIGKNPGEGTNTGKWMLTAIDNFFDVGNGKSDGAIVSWSINVQVVSNSQVQVNGNLIVNGTLTGSGGLSITGDMVIDGKLTVNKATALKAGLDMSTTKIANLGAPTAAADATTKAYVDAGSMIGYKQAMWENNQLDMSSTSWSTGRSISYTKQRADTVLVVEHYEMFNIRGYYGWTEAGHRILIDGAECTNPGRIEQHWAHYSPSSHDIHQGDTIAVRAICKATSAGPIGAGSHTIVAQGQRSYQSGNSWGPYWSYNMGGSGYRTARMGVGEIPDNQ